MTALHVTTRDDTADKRAMHYAVVLLSTIGIVVAVTLAALLYASIGAR